ncbi:hypothetical protein BT96DRAFT_923794 [Gymnopus androsaceus JB14]|uniref:Uncharacterized protein n=1 Tax=Gymnopus androsaceus JB14 TaxID=1447944 RepID=A0A6A4H9X2_9AGAR|nr:hypothetical protein BT96DRAFT_923794 [Gymnopus androsaceus JB14]
MVNVFITRHGPRFEYQRVQDVSRPGRQSFQPLCRMRCIFTAAQVALTPLPTGRASTMLVPSSP